MCTCLELPDDYVYCAMCFVLFFLLCVGLCVSGKRCGVHDLFVKEIAISLLFCGGELRDLTARNFSMGSLWVLRSSKVGMLQSGFLGPITMMINGNYICRL